MLRILTIPQRLTATTLVALCGWAVPASADPLQQQAQAIFGDGAAPQSRYSVAEGEFGRTLFF